MWFEQKKCTKESAALIFGIKSDLATTGMTFFRL